VLADGTVKSVRIHHVHMEEDAGKTIHDQDDHYSLVDLNRAGTPLLELVTEPDLSSGDEVLTFIATLQQLVRYLNISDGDMEKGSMRCDVNISVMPKGAKKFGERCEVKNVNSKRFAKTAVEYESKRQIAILERGETFNKQTLHFHSESGTTSPMRDKENVDDYRYFPDPDLPPIKISDDQITKINESLPAFPWEVKARLKSTYHLNEYDSNLLSADKEVADYFFKLVEEGADPKLMANLIINKIIPSFGNIGLNKIPVSNDTIVSFLNLIKTNTVSASVAYQKLWSKMIKNPKAAPLEIAKSIGIIHIKDNNAIKKIIAEVLSENTAQAEEYRNGKKKVLGFLIGQAMRKSKGAAPSDVVKKALLAALR
ncbi:MAG: Asp-tRNA(Asn)/Glu-tRNA(Gln) amidotransferase subunit GatB, partial [Saprospiraceae bacterium]